MLLVLALRLNEFFFRHRIGRARRFSHFLQHGVPEASDERGEINEEYKINGGASVECWTIYFDSYPPQELSANLVQHAIRGKTKKSY